MTWDKRPDMIEHEVEPYNAEPPRTGLAERMVTPLDTFYSRNHGPVPELDPEAWELRVDGLVGSPLVLPLAELRSRFPAHELVATLQCAGARRAGLVEVRDIPGEDPWGPGATSTARWTGARLADVLVAADLRTETGHVAFEAPDVSQIAEPPQAYGGSIPLPKALGSEVLLAWAMNGAPLTALHGGPVRVVVPGYIGARSVKWVNRVTVQTEPSDNYFQARAYRLLPPEVDPATAGPGEGLSLGPVALNADVLSPDDGATVPPGPTSVSGYAYAGEDRSVVRVDVSTDEGRTWQQAELEQSDGPWAWCLWHTEVELTSGPARILARAWDNTGASQPESPAHLWNPKGYVNNSWGRLDLTVRP